MGAGGVGTPGTITLTSSPDPDGKRKSGKKSCDCTLLRVSSGRMGSALAGGRMGAAGTESVGAGDCSDRVGVSTDLSMGMGGVEAAAWLLAKETSATSGALAATGGPLAIGLAAGGGGGASWKRKAGDPNVARYGREIGLGSASIC